MKITAILLFTMITFTHGKGGGTSSRSRGGYGSNNARSSNAKGYGYGAKSKSRNTRGPTHNEGYRHNYYAVYASLILFNTPSNTYLHNKEKKVLEAEPMFDCGNGVHITESKVCDWVNDCGNGMDERVPLPCDGIYSKSELYLYIILLGIYLLWILLIKLQVYLYKKKISNSDDNTSSYIHKKEEEMEYYGKMVCISFLPGIMLFITFIFLCTALVNEKSIIIEYYITSCFFIALNIIIACSIIKECSTFIIWLSIFIIAITTLFIGSIQFSHIPTGLPVNITNYEIYSNNSDIRNLTLENTFWLVKENHSTSFIIDFNQTIDLKILMIYPTYPYKTTDRFKIYNSLDNKNWTALVSGPMPIIKNKSAIEISFSEVQHTNMKYLKFIGEPSYSCNMTIEDCLSTLTPTPTTGLDYLEFYGVINTN